MKKDAKTQLMDLIKETVKEQIENTVSSPNKVDARLSKLDRYRVENNLSTYEMLEDVVEQIDEATWKAIIAGMNYKYGHSR